MTPGNDQSRSGIFSTGSSFFIRHLSGKAVGVERALSQPPGRTQSVQPLRSSCHSVKVSIQQSGWNLNLPKGSKYPIIEVSGSKNHTIGGYGVQSP